MIRLASLLVPLRRLEIFLALLANCVAKQVLDLTIHTPQLVFRPPFQLREKLARQTDQE